VPTSRARAHRSALAVVAGLVVLLLPLAQLARAQDLATAPIIDPAYGIKAFTITIPAGWKFQGTVLPGPECSQISFPVFRAYSPDGLSEIRLMPTFYWTFHPNTPNFHPTGCLDFGHTLTAAEFLKHYEEMVATSGMHVVGPAAIAPSYQRRVDGVGQNMNHISPDIHGSADAAAVRVETRNGSFVIEQRLRVYVECRVSDRIGPGAGGGCSAHVDVLRAPKGKLDALIAEVDAHDLVRTPNEDAWLQRVLQTNAQRNRERLRELTRQEQASAAMLKKQSDDFMATSQRNHEAFMAQQESSFRSSQNGAIDAMNARTTAASDWVDYSLDQQTVTGSGGTVKVSSSYAHTWSNGQNQWYQTNDPNANPNGALYGTWTENTKTHGNGQPY
jgi:hypothetical protein